jgi:hypothetical protein
VASGGNALQATAPHRRLPTSAPRQPPRPHPARCLVHAQASAERQPGRRDLLLGAVLLAAATAPPRPSHADPEPAAATASDVTAGSSADTPSDLVPFANPSQGYSILRPASWEQVCGCTIPVNHLSSRFSPLPCVVHACRRGAAPLAACAPSSAVPVFTRNRLTTESWPPTHSESERRSSFRVHPGRQGGRRQPVPRPGQAQHDRGRHRLPGYDCLAGAVWGPSGCRGAAAGCRCAGVAKQAGCLAGWVGSSRSGAGGSTGRGRAKAGGISQEPDRQLQNALTATRGIANSMQGSGLHCAQEACRLHSLHASGPARAVAKPRPAPACAPAAERAKESTLSVAMVEQSARSGAGGAAVYDYEYELESTRGRKRVLSTGGVGGGTAAAAIVAVARKEMDRLQPFGGCQGHMHACWQDEGAQGCAVPPSCLQ